MSETGVKKWDEIIGDNEVRLFMDTPSMFKLSKQKVSMTSWTSEEAKVSFLELFHHLKSG